MPVSYNEKMSWKLLLISQGPMILLRFQLFPHTDLILSYYGHVRNNLVKFLNPEDKEKKVKFTNGGRIIMKEKESDRNQLLTYNIRS